MKKFTITTKIMLLITFLFSMLACLYIYSNHISIGVVKSELKVSSFNRFSFFVNQIEENMDQISIGAYTLSKDPSILELGNRFSKPPAQVEKIIMKKNIMDKLILQSSASNWGYYILIYYPYFKEVISTMPNAYYDTKEIINNFNESWSYMEKEVQGNFVPMFVRSFTVPRSSQKKLNNVNIIFQVSFTMDNLRKMLSDFKAGGNGDPFLYHPGFEPITTNTPNEKMIKAVNRTLNKKKLVPSGSITIDINSKSYFINYQKSNNLGWYLIDYIPLQGILAPIERSQNLFNITIALSIFLIIIIWIILYRQIQVPIDILVHAIQRIKANDFSFRVEKKMNSEFGILFLAFNDMANEIQELIGRVYSEKIRAQQATLKQLQAQINPHFLYNCLTFVASMAKLKDYDSIIEMAYNLGKYYRYTTRLEKQNVSLKDEIEFVTSYLKIQNLRMQRIEFEILLPREMENLQIPRLLIQPLVENAIVHGIETKKEMGIIQIVCGEDLDEYVISIENNGTTLSEDELTNLNEKLRMDINDKTGFGAWNVYQRLLLSFGDESTLNFYASETGGVKAAIRWRKSAATQEM